MRRSRTRRCILRKERIDLLRDALIEALGNICANWQSGCLLPGENLEIDHVDGCTWDQRRVCRETRIIRYAREYREGVHLQILCRSCNGSKNQSVHGTRDRYGRRVDPHPELAEAPF